MKISDYQVEAGIRSAENQISYCQALEQIARENDWKNWAEFKRFLAGGEESARSVSSTNIYLIRKSGQHLALHLAEKEPATRGVQVVESVDPVDPALVAERIKLLYPKLPITRSGSARGYADYDLGQLRADLVDVSMYSDFVWGPSETLNLQPGHIEYGLSDFRFTHANRRFIVVRQIYTLMAMNIRFRIFDRGAFDGFLDVDDVCGIYHQSRSAASRNMRVLAGMSDEICVNTLLVEDLPVFDFCRFSRGTLCWKFTPEFRGMCFGYNTNNPLIEKIPNRLVGLMG